MTLDGFLKRIEFDKNHCFSNCYRAQIEHMIQGELIYRYKRYNEPINDAAHDAMYQDLMKDMLRWYDQSMDVNIDPIDHFVLIFRPLFVWVTLYRHVQYGKRICVEK